MTNQTNVIQPHRAERSDAGEAGTCEACCAPRVSCETRRWLSGRECLRRLRARAMIAEISCAGDATARRPVARPAAEHECPAAGADVLRLAHASVARAVVNRDIAPVVEVGRHHHREQCKDQYRSKSEGNEEVTAEAFRLLLHMYLTTVGVPRDARLTLRAAANDAQNFRRKKMFPLERPFFTRKRDGDRRRRSAARFGDTYFKTSRPLRDCLD